MDCFKNRLDAYGITIDNVIQVIRRENINVAGGEVLTAKKKYTLRAVGEYRDLNDIRNTVITVKNGVPVSVKETARVYRAPEDRQEIVRLNGKPGVILRINKQSDRNTVIVARNILKKLASIQKGLPAGMEITPFFNSAEIIESSIKNVITNALQGAIIAILVVFIFIRNLRASLILGLSMPISIIATYIAMYFFGITLNMMSMGGLAIGVGMLIDNSIVILENIFRFREKGARPTEAARLGADEMAMAITASLTTICVFIPFFFAEGLAGQLFTDMALTITFSLLCSLAVALTLIPMMTSRYLHEVKHDYTGKLAFINTLFVKSEHLLQKIEDIYARTINYALSHRRRIVGFTALSVIAGLLMIPLAGMEFMPEQDDGRLSFMAELPIGTNLDTTERALMEVETRLQKHLDPSEYRVISIRGATVPAFPRHLAKLRTIPAKSKSALPPRETDRGPLEKYGRFEEKNLREFPASNSIIP